MENNIQNNQTTEQKPEDSSFLNEEPKKPEESGKKAKKEKKQRRPAKVVMKTWSKGIAKETSRISWEKKAQVIKDFVVILVVSCILAALFFGIDMIIISIRK